MPDTSGSSTEIPQKFQSNSKKLSGLKQARSRNVTHQLSLNEFNETDVVDNQNAILRSTIGTLRTTKIFDVKSKYLDHQIKTSNDLIDIGRYILIVLYGQSL